jgi:tryptophan-rich sensory protein
MKSAIPTSKFNILPLLVILFITQAAGFIPALITQPNAAWYNMLTKPLFYPPSTFLALAWTFVYILIAIAAYLVWQRRDGSTNYLTARAVYVIQLMLNFLWSIVFFGFHSVGGALLVVILLWMIILLNIRWFGKVSKTAGWLLMPYFLWVSFAAILNYSIYTLNR